MSRTTRMRMIGILAVAGALTLGGAPAFAAPGGGAYTCTGGDIPSGTYSSLTVTGPCSVPSGAVVSVSGGVAVAAGAVFDAQTAPSTITVGGNVTAGSGALLGLGCQPPSMTGNSAHPCEADPEGHSTITVRGNITATGAAAVLLNGITVGGNVTLSGGGSQIPWSVKNDTIRGNLTISGQTTEWLGVLFNRIDGNTTLSQITLTDTDPGTHDVFVVRNTIRGNLGCTGITPGVNGGFVPGSVNVVGGRATGQCAGLV